MPSDEQPPIDPNNDIEASGDDPTPAPDPVENAAEPIETEPVTSADDPVEEGESTDPKVEIYVLPPDRPGSSATTGTGTSIAVGCVAVCAVILLITILILTIVS